MTAAFSLHTLLPKLCQPWKEQIKVPSLLHCCNSRSHFNFSAESQTGSAFILPHQVSFYS